MKAQRCAVLIYMLSFVTILGNASPLDDQYGQKLLQARQPHQIEEIQQLFSATRVTRQACRIELQERWLPVSCFEALAFESRLGLHTARSAREVRDQLDQHCREASANLRLPKRPNLKSLSSACRKSIEKALKIRLYRQRKEWSGT